MGGAHSTLESRSMTDLASRAGFARSRLSVRMMQARRFHRRTFVRFGERLGASKIDSGWHCRVSSSDGGALGRCWTSDVAKAHCDCC